MSGPRHKATVAKDMAISLVRPLLYFVPRESYCNPSKNWKINLKTQFQIIFLSHCSCTYIHVPALKERKKGKLVCIPEI